MKFDQGAAADDDEDETVELELELALDDALVAELDDDPCVDVGLVVD